MGERWGVWIEPDGVWMHYRRHIWCTTSEETARNTADAYRMRFPGVSYEPRRIEPGGEGEEA